MSKKSKIMSVMPPKELVNAADHKQVRRDEVTTTQEFKTLAEKVAKSTIFYKNYYVHELKEKFSYYDRMKRIDKVFPYADLDGRGQKTCLYVDEAKTESDVEIFKKKAIIMKGLGFLYCYFDNSDEDGDKLDHALEQLGRL